ncbi:hypothetical protein J1N35_034686 [Gossypium stocksii]|uniref:DUF4283 domain-containing protein n=1 Tax=Gossypium stocksii TaxID=47602 RepID=A0A9D3UST6_9ROSI|nr:hypothetical protein J1N35_034686 [Gossypium stocksii]
MIVLGCYLTVQPWSLKFSPLQAFPSSMMVWVRLPSQSRFLYKQKMLEKIGGLIGTITKLDFQIDKGLRGKFAKMAVCVDLGKLLVFQIMQSFAAQIGPGHVTSSIRQQGLASSNGPVHRNHPQFIMTKEFMESFKIHDLGFKGAPFTWFRSCIF